MDGRFGLSGLLKIVMSLLSLKKQSYMVIYIHSWWANLNLSVSLRNVEPFQVFGMLSHFLKPVFIQDGVLFGTHAAYQYYFSFPSFHPLTNPNHIACTYVQK